MSYKYPQTVCPWVQQIKLPAFPNTSQEGIPSLSSFDVHLEKNKHLSVDEFKTMFSPEGKGEPKYIPKIDFDPTSAEFYEQFVNPQKRPVNSHYAKTADFSLNDNEKSLFLKNGFVVINGRNINFAREYYRIFNNDLPVFVTADSILHAFHMSYDATVQQLETTFFSTLLRNLIAGMLNQLKGLSQTLNNAGSLYQSCKDADIFLTVALNLLTSELIEYIEKKKETAQVSDRGGELENKGDAVENKEETDTSNAETDKKSIKDVFSFLFPKKEPRNPHSLNLQMQFSEKSTKTPQIKTVFGSDALVSQILQAVDTGTVVKMNIFGKERDLDLSQMKPRGHYAKTQELRRYFRAMMWCGRIDMKVAGEGSSTRELAAAAVLHTLLTRSEGGEKMWTQFNELLEVLVGVPNSMTFTQLGILLNESCKLKDIVELDSEEALVKAQRAILGSKLGIKMYNSEIAESLGQGKKELARSFTMIGQRFSIDSWAMSKFVTDQIFWNDVKVLRKRTSAIEVAFSVLANDDTTPIIAARIQDDSKRNFRDGLPFQHNLVSVRQTVDELPKEAWKSSLYTYWLYSLRALSEPTLDAKYPQAMRTQAYAMKRLNTQLGSFSQLRHDNLLYVEPVYNFACGCSYPAGYVEPLVNFWKTLEDMCLVTANILTNAQFPDRADSSSPKKGVQKRQVGFYENFAKHVRVLHDISVKELMQQPLDENQTLFLKTITEGVGFMSGLSMWGGWYPELFYGGYRDADEDDLIVGDVFTACADPALGDPGCVLHEGLGYPRTMLITVDSGTEKCTYAGPVFSHYEFELPGIQRYSDTEWEKKVQKK